MMLQYFPPVIFVIMLHGRPCDEGDNLLLHTVVAPPPSRKWIIILISCEGPPGERESPDGKGFHHPRHSQLPMQHVLATNIIH
mmetsp:Transcript_3321/g.6239  ORF Transcript_3321/g.6239 Transcript_3321/m.6239 type:complete len:83 (+) Transcript_3321:2925-3173(+)